MTIMQQRSPEWRERRLGMVTASRFKSVLTPPRTKAAKAAGEMSATAKTYAHDLLTEMLISQPSDRFENATMRWGTEWEPVAFERAVKAIGNLGLEVEMAEGEFAFIEHPGKAAIGCSPDGIIGDDGLLELKCPYNPRVHLETVLSGQMPKEHKAQVQGSLWVTGRKRYVFASYHHAFEGSFLSHGLWFINIDRDDAYIDTELEPAVVDFRQRLDYEYAQLEERFRVTSGAPF